MITLKQKNTNKSQPFESLDTKGSLPVRERVVLNVNFDIDVNLGNRLDELFPSYRIVSSNWGSTKSLHPILHCERMIKEIEAVKLCKGRIVDIGGNPQRHHKFGRNIWSMVPRKTAADIHRHDKFEESDCFMYCEHSAPDFKADCCCSHADTFLSVDSLYYLSKEDVLAVVEKAPLIAVIHDFAESLGGYYDEARYEVTPEGDVKMSVNGSSIAYSHSALCWLRESSCYWNPVKNIGFSWYLIKSVGTSLVYRFMVNTEKIDSDPMTLSTALTDKSKYASPRTIGGEQLKGLVGEHSLVVLPWGGSVVVRWGHTVVTVPKSAVAAARMASVYTPRTAGQFQIVVRKVKERVERDNDIDTWSKPDVVVIASALGFVADMHREVLCLDAVQAGLRVIGKNHNSALDFNLYGVGKKTMIAGATTTVAALTYIPGVDSAVWYTLKTIFFNQYLLTVLVATLVMSYSVTGSLIRGPQALLLHVQGRDHGSLTSGGNLDVTTLPAYQSERASLSPGPGAMFRYSYAWKKIRDRGAQFIGVGVAGCIPVVSVDSPNNEERAIIHRALNTDLIAVEGEWAKVGSILKELIPERVIRAVSFELWNSRFPVTRQRAQAKALQEFNSCPDDDTIRRSCVRKTFIKREKLLKSSPLGVDDFDPRVIQGTSDLANSLLGPWMYSFGKFLSTTWKTTKSVCYASGMNAEELGLWMDRTVADGFVYWVQTDFSRFDKSICVEALEIEQEIYKRAGVGRKAMCVLQEQKFVHGKSSHGHRYSVRGTRCSGDPNTSPGNSMLDAGALVYALNACNLFEYRILVMGDDSVIALKLKPISVEYFVAALARLGLKAKTILLEDPDIVEFCSGRFWATDSHRVWGPKIGRFLAKTGYSVAQQNNPKTWLKGVLVGSAQDVSHVPLLNTYVSHCLALLKDVKASARADSHKFHVAMKHKPSPETYAQFYKLYDLTEGDYDSMKAEILSIKQIPYLLDNPLFDTLIDVDC